MKAPSLNTVFAAARTRVSVLGGIDVPPDTGAAGEAQA